ncbi:MAG: 2Fe-2S iron-sulfur cluster-binding protein [candidate division Zixibacteria bacterium]|nr:2Fe-2S iron-sulfur cluster-binding protein [candidate division Zixibacteria bacterium]
MVSLTINGRVVQAEKGEMLLAVCKREGIEIPALCHHDAVEPFGACRLCMVEITKEEWDGWSNCVTSCLYPVAEGLIVQTHSPEVIELRKTVLDLLLARCPDSQLIRKMAAEYGVTQTSYEPVPDGDNCILCGLCTRVCEQMGFSAISTVGRGHDKEVATPLRQAPPDCVGCLSCVQVCPTGVIKYTDQGNHRTIWEKDFELIKCSKCGKTTITKDFAKKLSESRDIPEDYFDLCDDCHRKELSLTMGSIAAWTREVPS